MNLVLEFCTLKLFRPASHSMCACAALCLPADQISMAKHASCTHLLRANVLAVISFCNLLAFSVVQVLKDSTWDQWAHMVQATAHDEPTAGKPQTPAFAWHTSWCQAVCIVLCVHHAPHIGGCITLDQRWIFTAPLIYSEPLVAALLWLKMTWHRCLAP
jgi:hypothetical protein